MMYATLASMIDVLDRVADLTPIIRWSCPVPVFGNIHSSRLATLGLNPSSREFVDALGNELRGTRRRFPTLRSMGLRRWGDANTMHVHKIMAACEAYFGINPYDRWFRRLDAVISRTGTSFYSETNAACHIDLIPYATATKWNDISLAKRRMLLESSEGALGRVLRDSPIEVVVLNGRSVVDHFMRAADSVIKTYPTEAWTLTRASGKPVQGIAYRGTTTRVGGIDLDRAIMVLGFNHNIQSSFGVTTEAVAGIGRWLQRRTAAVL